MTFLHTVTITGADDAVDPADLAKLSERYPFVEWGLLWNMKPAKPRYPSHDWLRQAWWLHRRSLHLCGFGAREVMNSGNIGPALDVVRLVGAQRVQLNGFSQVTQLSRLRPFLEALGDIECIMQCPGPVQLMGAGLCGLPGHNVSALLDASGGRGVPLGEIPPLPEGLHVGFAGGITPDNMVATLQRLEALGRPYWVDLETGARDEQDRFDLGRAEAALSLAESFVTGGAS